jgi:hypothetical protein
VQIDVQAHVPIERMSDYKLHILYVSVSLKTARCISFTAVTGCGSVFCRVTIFLCVRHLRDFISHIWERQDMSSECEATAAVNLRKRSFKIRHRVFTQSIRLLRCPVSNLSQRPEQMRSHPREWGRTADERPAMIRQYLYIDCSTCCRPH